jgi:hypothetical protein
VTATRALSASDFRKRQLSLLGICATGVVLLLLVGTWIEGGHRALRTGGVTTLGVVTECLRDGGGYRTLYEYAVDGERRERNASMASPIALGPTRVLYLPDRPQVSWPGGRPSDAEVRLVSRPFRMLAMILGAVGVVFASVFEVGRRRAARGAQGRLNDLAGTAVATLIVGAALFAQTFEDVQDVQARAFGAAPLGVPIRFLMPVVVVLLGLPLFLIGGHMMALRTRALEDGRLGSVGFVLWLLGRRPAALGLGRARAILLAVGAGYAALLLAWIAFAAHRGV